jgi:hypothetical protein
LSSLTLHVEHSELRKESNVVLKPMADTGDQIDFERCFMMWRTVWTHDGMRVGTFSSLNDDGVDPGIQDRLWTW